MAKILFIEDDVLIQNSFKRTLKAYELIVVSTGLEALSELQEGQFDLVISDYDLKGALNGEDVYLWVKINRPDLDKKYIFCSANDRSEKVCEENGLTFLPKGFFTPAELKQAISKVVEAKS